MLTSLSIRDFVLIERLDLEFAPGLCVLTGETGAGKSILLDALGLATGGRVERGFIRNGATQAAVSAVFDPPAAHPVRAALRGNGLDSDGPLILRRSVGADGRSLVLKPLDVPAIEATRALELWAVPSDGAPRSLGLVSADQGAVIRRAGLLTGTAAFAVSLEPAGGSPTGAPTGPILSLGRVAL